MASPCRVPNFGYKCVQDRLFAYNLNVRLIFGTGQKVYRCDFWNQSVLLTSLRLTRCHSRARKTAVFPIMTSNYTRRNAVNGTFERNNVITRQKQPQKLNKTVFVVFAFRKRRRVFSADDFSNRRTAANKVFTFAPKRNSTWSAFFIHSFPMYDRREQRLSSVFFRRLG